MLACVYPVASFARAMPHHPGRLSEQLAHGHFAGSRLDAGAKFTVMVAASGNVLMQ
jgi:hypothetical protein